MDLEEGEMDLGEGEITKITEIRIFDRQVALAGPPLGSIVAIDL